MPGARISDPEVVQVTPFGIWLAYGDEELYLDHEEFPWFREAPVKQVFNVREVSQDHFYWPELDVDLDLDRIRHRERYPLKADHAE
jgi:hypothetical protein